MPALATPTDFHSVRYVFAGAERVAPRPQGVGREVRAAACSKGYGATETAPVIAINTPCIYRAGTVGRLLPGIDHRIEKVAASTRRTARRGRPERHAGYLRAERPGALERRGGWYDTGDIVEIDAAGFVTIAGRPSAYAKIAGEMISLGAVEEQAARLLAGRPPRRHRPARRARGEQLVLVTDRGRRRPRGALLAQLRAGGLGELAMRGRS